MKRLTTAILAGFLLCWIAPASAMINIVNVVNGLDQPVGVKHAGDGSGRLFIVSQRGEIVIYDGQQVLPTPYLDITDRVLLGSEQGLLGLAFHPNYAANGEFYLNYTDFNGDTVISRFNVSGNLDVADSSSEAVLATIPQPFQNHNGGEVAFGPDGYLYIATGDGGDSGDPGNRAQDLGQLLGKILRIDIDQPPFAIPPDNPFVDVPGARPEIWAYGLRNPWRFSFDRSTGDLIIGDVGQNDWEEIDFQSASSPGGENYGWRLMEGAHCFNPGSNCNDGSLTLPILEYAHFSGGFQGCAVIGGQRYRGSDFPALEGVYFYGDNCTGRIWGAIEGDATWFSTELLDTSLNINSFGEDEDGEIYLVGSSGLYRVVGTDPFCRLELSQASYTAGETITLAEARFVNLGSSATPVHFELEVFTPGGVGITLFDVGADGSLVLPAGLSQDFAPLPLATVTASTPLGTYDLRCRFLDPVSGELLFERANTLTLD